MTRARMMLIGALLFLSGGAVTLVLEHHVVGRRPPVTPAAVHALLLNQMDSALQLTPGQRDSIHAIFVRHQSVVDSVWGSMNHRMQATMDSVHRDLIRVLEADQLDALHDWMQHQRGAHPRSH